MRHIERVIPYNDRNNYTDEAVYGDAFYDATCLIRLSNGMFYHDDPDDGVTGDINEAEVYDLRDAISAAEQNEATDVEFLIFVEIADPGFPDPRPPMVDRFSHTIFPDTRHELGVIALPQHVLCILKEDGREPDDGDEGDLEEYWLGRGDGFCTNPNDAHIYTLAEVIEIMGSMDGTGDTWIIILDRNPFVANPTADTVAAAQGLWATAIDPYAAAVAQATNSPVAVEPVEVWFDQVAITKTVNFQSIKDWPGDREVLVSDTVGTSLRTEWGTGQFWKPMANGYTSIPAEAGRFKISYVVSSGWWNNNTLSFHIIHQGTVPQVPDGKKCLIEMVLSKQVIELIKIVPTNEVARAQVLAAVLQPIPDEHVTFDAIKGWIESTIERKVAIRPNKTAVSLITSVRVNRSVSGTCRYHGNETARWNRAISPERMRELVADCLRDEEDLHSLTTAVINNISADIEDEDENGDLDLNAGEGYEYEDHSESSHGEVSVEITSPAQLRDSISRWMRDYWPDAFHAIIQGRWDEVDVDALLEAYDEQVRATNQAAETVEE